jgi:hypothetical protein
MTTFLTTRDQIKVYRHDIIKVGVNGVLLMCPGLMDGQLLVCTESCSQNKILLLAMASNPDLTPINKIFHQLIQEKFPQCIHTSTVAALSFYFIYFYFILFCFYFFILFHFISFFLILFYLICFIT